MVLKTVNNYVYNQRFIYRLWGIVFGHYKFGCLLGTKVINRHYFAT